MARLLTIADEGQTSSPRVAMQGAWGPDLSSFTVVSDVRLTGDPAGKMVFLGFRGAEVRESGGASSFDGYRLALLLDRQAILPRNGHGAVARSQPSSSTARAATAPSPARG